MISGLLVLNKPTGVSSGNFIRKLKPIINNSKIGHSGTLDPLASGVILACIGQMTRFTNFLASEKKTYVAEMMFGFKTSTGDLDGQIIEEINFIPKISDFKKVLKNYTGIINQEAPIFSSLKYKGKPMYKYARKNKVIPKKERMITISKIDLLSVNDNKFKILVECGKGTYIRSLVNDIALDLKSTAVLSSLKRIDSAKHQIEDAYEIDSITKHNISRKIISMGDALKCIDEIQCPPEIIDRIRKGQKIYLKGAELKSKHLRLFDKNKVFVGVLNNSNGLVSPKRLISIEN